MKTVSAKTLLICVCLLLSYTIYIDHCEIGAQNHCLLLSNVCIFKFLELLPKIVLGNSKNL